MTRGTALALGIAIGTALYVARVSAEESAGSVAIAPDAVAYHGAAHAYGQVAAFFGRLALRAEKAYWKAIDR